MCGICGVVSSDPRERFDGIAVQRMRDTLAHRGPDDCGLYLGPGVGLGHRRLSIIDLRPEGRQPMSNEDGRIRIVFNGEIYNFAEIRKWLLERGHTFASRSDTETIVHLYEEMGVRCVERLRGMFAFAIWDERSRSLMLARDRLGKKPLYYSIIDGKRMVFASEPKAILAWPGIRREADPAAIDSYLAWGFVPGSLSAFSGLKKLPPAHYLLFRHGRAELNRYWRLSYEPKIRIDENEARGEILRRLEQAVKIRLVSDVPVGAFLSGGIDSSAVVAMMARSSSSAVKTFTIKFNERDHDESEYAREVAGKFATEHHEFLVEPRVHEVLEPLVRQYDEPYADPSAIPTYYLSQLARRHVTVALNGDGGDENFAGYARHSLHLLSHRLNLIPRPLRRTAAAAASAGYARMGGNLEVARRLALAGQVLSADPASYESLFAQFGCRSRREFYSREFIERVDGSSEPGADGAPADTCDGPIQLAQNFYRESDAEHPLDRALYVDCNLYLPDDLLVKVDIASMANSLEARSPLLDHEFMEFVARLPSRMKATAVNRKILLKGALRSLLPDRVLGRRKMGFGLPIEHWFRGELADMTEDLLLGGRFAQRGYFDRARIAAVWSGHKSGAANHHLTLWKLVMLELWFRNCIDESRVQSAEQGWAAATA